ncbi:MAG: hypothetical protein HY905_09815 [Deltaproteobacteria bacterium]|nr:hypothetical protein [Deltaproteobacteria bacterium]
MRVHGLALFLVSTAPACEMVVDVRDPANPDGETGAPDDGRHDIDVRGEDAGIDSRDEGVDSPGCRAAICVSACTSLGYETGECVEAECRCRPERDAGADADAPDGDGRDADGDGRDGDGRDVADADSPDADAEVDVGDADADGWDADGDAGGGGRILVFFGSCGAGLEHISPALANLHLAADATITTDVPTFSTRLAAGSWDLIVVDNYTNGIGDAAMAMLEAHVAAGGGLILASWELYSEYAAHGLVSRAGVRLSSEYTHPLPIYHWRTAPLFSTPNAVPDLDLTADRCGVDGQHMEPTTAIAHAGYTRTAGTDQAALTVSPDGRVVLHGFMPQLVSQDADLDGKQDMVELYENELELLL